MWATDGGRGGNPSCQRADTHPSFRLRDPSPRPDPWKADTPARLADRCGGGDRVGDRRNRLVAEDGAILWRNPIERGRFQSLTDFDGTEQAAAVSRDGKFVAFLSDRDGHTDVWVTQPGSGQFHNLTHGSAPELVNPSVRTLGFSPDGSLVTFWTRKPAERQRADRRMGGTNAGRTAQALSGRRGGVRLVARRFTAHLPYALLPGDPLFVSDGAPHAHGRPIFTAPAGLHSHFPLWAPDNGFIYFVGGALPDKLDIWRIKPAGGQPERITSHNGRVSHPVLLNRRTLMYLANDPDGTGPWLYSIDVERRIPHRLTFGPDRYTSLAATADGKLLVVTRASPRRSLWRMRIGDLRARVPGSIPNRADARDCVFSHDWGPII